MNHKQAHIRIDKIAIVQGFGILILCIAIQVAAIFSENDWLKAISLRIYYFPVIFVSIRGGMVSGAIVSIVSILSHLLIMFLFSSVQNEMSHNHHSFIEHVIEMPFLFVAAIITGILSDHYLMINQQKQNIENIFERYVSKSISKKILNNEIHTEGEMLEATVLFTDIRAFTEMSEGATPRETLLLLNLYFSAMTEILLDNGAFIDKFIGDAIMAVFGVPLSDIKSTDLAIQSSIDMKNKLKELNQKNVFGDKQLDISIGLHTGSLVAGLIGSKKRQDYTVIGDTVNLAARIESLNRMYHSHILASDITMNQLQKPENVLFREVDSVRVKGRNAPTVIYEIFNVCGPNMIELKKNTLADFSRGLAFYKAGNWNEAEQCFACVLNNYKNDPISNLYLERLEILKKNPPANWDGVYSLDVK